MQLLIAVDRHWTRVTYESDCETQYITLAKTMACIHDSMHIVGNNLALPDTRGQTSDGQLNSFARNIEWQVHIKRAYLIFAIFFDMGKIFGE